MEGETVGANLRPGEGYGQGQPFLEWDMVMATPAQVSATTPWGGKTLMASDVGVQKSHPAHRRSSSGGHGRCEFTVQAAITVAMTSSHYHRDGDWL